ncbi:MAG: pyridoxal phosphate-dependent aminotransferase [Alphaproteobacteria bacterium]|nr:pyridoxal phosphate-dependent aminotransferase [Alphaproteobacteria bacterium]
MSPLRPDILRLRANGIARVASEELGNPEIIALWFGETDLVTPGFIREAAKRALDAGATFYVHGRGLLELRQAIAEFHARMLGTRVDVERITVPGAAMLAVALALQCMIEKGDRLVVVSPVWPNIFQAAEVAGAEISFVPLVPEWGTSWRLDLDRLFDACDAKTKAIFIASPGNPTGWVMSATEQQQVLAFARKRGIGIISDEVYGCLVYGEEAHAPSFLQIAEPDDQLFVVNSFSKNWAMTGWRVGWLVHPRSLDEAVGVMSVSANTGATSFAQHGALAALSPEGDAFLGKMRERCRQGRETVARYLAEQNRMRWLPPMGAFYGFVSVPGLKDSLGFVQSLVRSARVGVAPGSAFGAPGDSSNDEFIRICFAQNPERLAEGLRRIGAALA